LCNTIRGKQKDLCRAKQIYTGSEKRRIEIKLREMDTTEETGNWKECKGRLSQKFTSLTENNMMIEEGKTEEVLGKLEMKLGKTKDELRKIIDSF